MVTDDGSSVFTRRKMACHLGTFGKAQVWNVEAPNEPAIISTPNAEAMVFSPDSATLAIASREGIYLWEFRIEAEDEPPLIPVELHGFKKY